MDLTPVITPVLDLSEITSGAKAIDSIITPNALSATVSYNAASQISSSTPAPASTDATSTGESVTSAPTFSFVQNNNSPKAISNTELYRQTSNLLSIAKGQLPN